MATAIVRSSGGFCGFRADSGGGFRGHDTNLSAENLQNGIMSPDFPRFPDDNLIKGESNHDIALLFRGTIKDWSQSDEEPIWRYYPLEDFNFWGYQRTRLQLKAMIHIAYLFNISISGHQMTKSEISQIREGTIFPDPLMENRSHVAWHPDEYIFCEIDTFQPHDIEEAQQVRKFIHQDFYHHLEKCDGIDLKRLQHSSQSHRKKTCYPRGNEK